jgi:hypothetical protein
MFNWICPECGRDVCPSESECRLCAERKKAAAVVAPAVDPAPAYSVPPPQPGLQPGLPIQPTQYQPPQPQPLRPDPQSYAAPPPPQQQYYAPPPAQQPPANALPYYPPGGYPPPKKTLPTWLLSILFALAFIGLGAAIFFGYQYFGRGPRAERAGVTEPAATARSKPANALQKYIEVIGIRLVQDAKHHPQARFIVVNHSNAELNDLTANVTIWASTSRSEEDSVGTFSFKLGTIAGNESKEMTAPFNTKLKVYELPDWQNATADVQIAQP